MTIKWKSCNRNYNYLSTMNSIRHSHEKAVLKLQNTTPLYDMRRHNIIDFLMDPDNTEPPIMIDVVTSFPTLEAYTCSTVETTPVTVSFLESIEDSLGEVKNKVVF